MEYTMHRKRCNEKEERRESGKIDRTDLDWRVEQKLARVLAERDTYVDGFIYGFLTAMIIAVVVGFSIYPEYRKAK